MEAKKTSKKASTVKMVVASDIPSVQELTVTASKGDILLSWKAIEGCKYNIYRRSDCFSRPFYIGESKTNFFTDDKLVSGQIYHYLIQTVRPSSERALLGNFTEECACAFVDATEIASAKKIWGRAVIDVNVVAGADGYIFERSDSKDGGFTEVGRTTDITAISFEEKLPSRLKTYYYRARAYKKSADKEFYGQYSSVKAVR